MFSAMRCSRQWPRISSSTGLPSRPRWISSAADKDSKALSGLIAVIDEIKKAVSISVADVEGCLFALPAGEQVLKFRTRWIFLYFTGEMQYSFKQMIKIIDALEAAFLYYVYNLLSVCIRRLAKHS